MGYTDPATVHNPSSGGVATAAWGDQINANQQWFAQPAQAKVYRSSNFSVADTTETAVEWNAEEWDTDTIHSLVSNTSRLTATTAGLYRVEFRPNFAPSAGGTVRRARLWLNGTSGTLLDADQDNAPSASWGSRLRVAATVNMAAADYVECVVYQDSGGALNVGGAAIGTSERAWGEIRWVGIAP